MFFFDSASQFTSDDIFTKLIKLNLQLFQRLLKYNNQFSKFGGLMMFHIAKHLVLRRISPLLLLLFLIIGTVKAEIVGTVTPANSIIGSSSNDQIGSNGVIQLPGGNLVIVSPNWNGGRGA